MANPDHLEKLCQGARAWNEWREANPAIIPDLRGVQLTLNQRQLGPSNGGPIDLRGADLEGAVLRYATLTGANFEDARLVGADLTHARLDEAQLMGANLTDALLDQADLTRAALDQAVLFGADFSNARNLTSAQLEPAYGDASTRLPGHITPPQSWFPAEAEAEEDYSGWQAGTFQPELDQDLYETLGIARTATGDDIRAAYRMLVKKLHPDLNPDNAEAQERFKRVTNAYRLLSAPEERVRYDRGEIDAEGNVDPEFEARRRIRRTTYRYYAAAAASFFLAVGVLAAVWHTVLFRQPDGDAATQIAAVSPPKRAERLGDAQPANPKLDDALTEQPVVPKNGEVAEPSREAASAPLAPEPVADARPDTTAPAGGGGAERRPVEDRQAALAETAAPNAEAAATPGEAASRPQSNAEQRETAAGPPAPAPAIPAKQEEAPAPPPTEQQSAGTAPNDTAAATAPHKPEPAAESAPVAGASQARGAGGSPGPLREAHQAAAGQTNPSSPEPWSVAALPPAPPILGQGGDDPARRNAQLSGPSDLPLFARRPPAQSVVSRVLGKRAVRKAMGAQAKPILAKSEPAAAGERRAGIAADVPTNALPNKARSSTDQSAAAASPNSIGQRAAPRPLPRSSLASASKASDEPQLPNHEARHQQAVSDILAGGM